jgi:hypothetical protein
MIVVQNMNPRTTNDCCLGFLEPECYLIGTLKVSFASCSVAVFELVVDFQHDACLLESFCFQKDGLRENKCNVLSKQLSCLFRCAACGVLCEITGFLTELRSVIGDREKLEDAG